MKKLTYLGALVVLALGAMACTDDVQSCSGANCGTAGNGGSGATGGGGNGGSGATGGGGNGGGGSGELCGGIAGIQCSTPGEFCDFQPSTCGGDDGAGVCVPKGPDGCPEIYDPVCGCDGMVYGNDCEALAAGVDIDVNNNCPLPGDSQFACGAGYCDYKTSYCRRSVSDVGGEDDYFTCEPLPAACGGDPSCACLEAETCGEMCTGEGSTGLTLTCPGG